MYKVLVLPSWYPAPNEPINGQAIYDQCLALSNQQVDLTIFYSNLRANASPIKASSVVKNQTHFPEYILEGFCFGKRHKWTFQRWLKRTLVALQDTLDLDQFDIIHAHSFHGAILASEMQQFNDLPYVVTEHSSRLVSKEIPSFKEEYIRKAYDGAASLIAVSSYLRKEMAAYSKNEITVIPNVLSNKLQQSAGRSSSRSASFNIISVGNLTKNKNQQLLINSCAALAAEKRQQISIQFIGKGPEQQRLIDLAAKADLNTVFRGEMDHSKTLDAIAEADLMVMTSKSETFGVVGLEALALGVPVIATPSGGVHDFINEQTGKLLKSFDQPELTFALEEALDATFQPKAEKIKKWVQENYFPKPIALSIISEYNRVLS